MATVYARKDEPFESLYKRFKKAVDNSGVLSDLKKSEFFEKPSVKRKKKSENARKKESKRQRKLGNKARKIQDFVFNKDKTQKIYKKRGK